jgi:uncharacterized repeat protein (TIGR03803 family)
LCTLLVLQVAQAQTYTVLHTFTAKEGRVPGGALIRDRRGYMYGVFYQGGRMSCNANMGCGTLFRLDPAGNVTVLHTFTDDAGQGWAPWGTLVADSDGNLYGTSSVGGMYGMGTVYRFNLKTRQYSTLYSFSGPDGRDPIGRLFRDSSGNLFGATYYGGISDCIGDEGYGCGTVFKLDPAGNETVLHNFSANDGTGPYTSVIGDSAGNLYGTAMSGGNSPCTVFSAGC